MTHRERPILFSGPMVRAILEERKTQTRRIIKPKSYAYAWLESAGFDPAFVAHPGNSSLCPYGQTGDQLWVRETFYPTKLNDGRPIYRADAIKDDSGERSGYWVGKNFIPGTFTWTPCIHMPRWASRITLEITNVRVERIASIKIGDTYKEGVFSDCNLMCMKTQVEAQMEAFRSLWNSLAKPGSDWEANPWVWVIEFKRVNL